jgi:hypothetical protein
MSAGFQVGSGIGEILIDSTNIKMFLRHFGVASSNIVVPAQDPVVFVRPLIDGAGGGLLSAANGSATVGIWGGACEYYVFDRPVSASALDAWNEQGVQIFTAAQRPLNIIGSVTVPNYFEGSTGGWSAGWEYAGLQSGKYAYNQSYIRDGMQWQGAPGGGYTTNIWQESFRSRPNGFFISFSRFCLTLFGWRPLATSYGFLSNCPPCPVSIIDVAGIL